MEDDLSTALITSSIGHGMLPVSLEACSIHLVVLLRYSSQFSDPVFRYKKLSFASDKYSK